MFLFVLALATVAPPSNSSCQRTDVPLQSWHIHVLFPPSDAVKTAAALDFQLRFIDAFGLRGPGGGPPPPPSSPSRCRSCDIGLPPSPASSPSAAPRAIGSSGITGSKEPGQFRYPDGVAYDGTSIYVGDTNNNRVQKVSIDGAHLGTVGKADCERGDGEGQFCEPSTLCVAAGATCANGRHAGGGQGPPLG